MRALMVLTALTLGASPAAFEALRNGDTAVLTKALDAGLSSGPTIISQSIWDAECSSSGRECRDVGGRGGAFLRQ